VGKSLRLGDVEGYHCWEDKMVKILILGSTGMLGSAVGKWFLDQGDRYETTLTHRNKDVAMQHYDDNNLVYFDCLESDVTDLNLSKYDYVINCIGTIKPFMDSNPLAAIRINSVFPWILANNCNKSNTKLIHITTDCVYSGTKGQYTEEDGADALDAYGKSKSLGEPNTCMTLRTSIIGEEIHKNASLIEWVKGQRGNVINGYTNHDWNGVTTKEYAKVCDKIITSGLYENGCFHVHSPHPVSKYELVSLIGNKFDLELTVNAFEAPIKIDRTLASVASLCNKLNVPTVSQQIDDL
jgi:dTDP-4-dehydrorhamnose reductase